MRPESARTLKLRESLQHSDISWDFLLHLAAVDLAGGSAEGAAGRRLRRVSGGRAGPHQALRAAATDHPASHRQPNQGRRGPHQTAEVDPSVVPAEAPPSLLVHGRRVPGTEIGVKLVGPTP